VPCLPTVALVVLTKQHSTHEQYTDRTSVQPITHHCSIMWFDRLCLTLQDYPYRLWLHRHVVHFTRGHSELARTITGIPRAQLPVPALGSVDVQFHTAPFDSQEPSLQVCTLRSTVIQLATSLSCSLSTPSSRCVGSPYDVSPDLSATETYCH